MRKYLIYLAVGLLVSGLGLYCFGQELAENQVLRVASPDDDITGLDPFDFLGTSAEPMSRAIYEGLVRFNFGFVAVDQMEPALAESWTVSSDGLLWTFYLREGVQFHHGYGEFTAEDAKFSIDRLVEGNSRHAADYATVEEIVVVDPYTLEFHLSEPNPFFLFTVGNFHGGSVVSKKAVEELGEGFRSMPVGTGPFEFKEWLSKEKVVLEGFDEYWRGEPVLESIEFIFMPDVNTRTLALESGQVDTATDVPDEEAWVQNMRNKGVIVDALGYDIPLLCHFNMTVEPLNDIRVRQALSYAINRDDFVQFHGPSICRPQVSVLPPGMYGSITEGVPLYEYNPEKARELLAEAGYPNGFDLGVALSSVRDLYLDPLEIIQAQWAEIGVSLEINAVAHTEYHALIRQDLSPVVVYPGPRPTPDMIFTQYIHSDAIVGKETAITNFSHYGDVDCDGDGTVDSVDEYVELARSEVNTERQKALYAIAQLQTLLDLPVYPLRVLAAVQARQTWVDLGHVPYEGSYINGYAYTELTQILKH